MTKMGINVTKSLEKLSILLGDFVTTHTCIRRFLGSEQKRINNQEYSTTKSRPVTWVFNSQSSVVSGEGRG